MKQELISIGEAASILGVSIDTLRRWDKSGKLKPIKSKGGHRIYNRFQIELFLNDLFGIANDWVFNNIEMPPEFYCANSAVFQTRLAIMQGSLADIVELASQFPWILDPRRDPLEVVWR